MRYSLKWPEYAAQWNKMIIKPARQAEFDRIAANLFGHKDRYKAVEHATGVPWYLVAVLHQRESDADFSTYLGNGDPLNRPTRHVPKGRGPFPTWQAGAIDAIKLDGLNDVKDWRLEKQLFWAERFNGTGYDQRGLPSPYVWGGTNIQKPGKYVADGRWSGSTWDGQPGVAPIIATLVKLDPTIQLTRED